MKSFIIKNRNALERVASAVFWLAVWQLSAALIGRQLLLASPLSVLAKLSQLAQSPEFYAALGGSLLHIAAGFLSAAALGCALAALAHRYSAARVLLHPMMTAIKATPVASFIILALILAGSKHLAALMSFIMVLPVFYTNLLAGLGSVDRPHLEAAEVFGMLGRDRFRFIYLPSAAPAFRSACALGVGMAWKSGVAAEVIGLTAASIGERMYEAKLYLDTAELFAYTLALVLLSFLMERLLLAAVRRAERALRADEGDSLLPVSPGARDERNAV